MNIEEIKKHLRKEYGKWPWQGPKRSDRLFLTEEQWEQIDWTPEEIERNIALPHKLWNMRHDDHLWPRNYQWRGNDAYGYRAGEGHPKYMPKLPKLVEGRGIARWMADGDSSVAEVPELSDYRKVWTPDNLPQIIEFYERNPGNPNFGKGLLKYSQKTFLKTYAPSALQKFSNRSYLLRDPKHVSLHKMIQKNEVVGDPNSKADWVLFKRKGCRWDSYDGYIIKDATFYGLHWN